MWIFTTPGLEIVKAKADAPFPKGLSEMPKDQPICAPVSITKNGLF
jgi:hypothetical protein